MSDKRSVATDALQTLGTIIESGGRDAIHLAVEPVTALDRLFAGQDIGIENGGATTFAKKKLGIVDPFLKRPVEPGEKFWLIVYPRQITSLRHVWNHPDFQDETIEIKKEAEPILDRKTFSENWLKEFCRDNDAPSYHGVMSLIEEEGVEDDDGCFFVGDLDGHCEIPEEFWINVEIVTGRKISARPTHFSCSC